METEQDNMIGESGLDDSNKCRQAAGGVVIVDFPPIPASMRADIVNYKRWLSVNSFWGKVL